MKDDAKLRSAAGLSKLWDGEPWKRVRATDGAQSIANKTGFDASDASAWRCRQSHLRCGFMRSRVDLPITRDVSAVLDGHAFHRAAPDEAIKTVAAMLCFDGRAHCTLSSAPSSKLAERPRTSGAEILDRRTQGVACVRRQNRKETRARWSAQSRYLALQPRCRSSQHA